MNELVDGLLIKKIETYVNLRFSHLDESEREERHKKMVESLKEGSDKDVIMFTVKLNSWRKANAEAIDTYKQNLAGEFNDNYQ